MKFLINNKLSMPIYNNQRKKIIYNKKKWKEFSNIDEMINSDLKEGDLCITRGYFFSEDNGGGKYQIVSYENWYNELPLDIKAISTGKDGLGNFYLIKTPVDEFGNHTIKNGLVAKLLISDVTTPEQWGARGDGKTNDVYPFIHLFAQLKTGKIVCKHNATYLLGLTENYDNPYRAYMCGSIIGGQYFSKPIMGNIKNVIIDGNDCNITIPDGKYGDSGMGIFNFSGDIENLEIVNFNFDGNCYNITEGKATNHTIFYNPSSLYMSQLTTHFDKDIVITHPKYNNLTDEFSPCKIKNWTIRKNNFKNAGTAINLNDSGGDFILLINPNELDGMCIEDNTFTNWGRWVFAIDLGGNGERLYNISFNRNKCIQENEIDKLPYKAQRGLGLIDFEARKCFTNVEIKDNYINGINGIAINGSSQITENFTFSGNTIIRPLVWYKSSYPYGIEFYSGYMKNLLFENNSIAEGSGTIKFGLTLDNAIIRNNDINVIFRIPLGIYGTIIFDHNKSNQANFLKVESVNIPPYINSIEKEECNFIYSNNIGGIQGALYDYTDLRNTNHLNINIENNIFTRCNIMAFGTKSFKFNNPLLENVTFSARGANFDGPTYSLPNNPIIGGGIFKEDSVVTTNLQNGTVSKCDYYWDGTVMGIKDFEKYNYNYNNLYNEEGLNKVVCIKEGYLPMNGQFSYAESDVKFFAGLKVSKGTYVYTDEAIYISCNDGVLGETLNHKEGKLLSGEVEMQYLYNLAKISLQK